jgi:hypothetical protein
MNPSIVQVIESLSTVTLLASARDGKVWWRSTTDPDWRGCIEDAVAAVAARRATATHLERTFIDNIERAVLRMGGTEFKLTWRLHPEPAWIVDEDDLEELDRAIEQEVDASLLQQAAAETAAVRSKVSGGNA